jgi:hypothetical protein
VVKMTPMEYQLIPEIDGFWLWKLDSLLNDWISWTYTIWDISLKWNAMPCWINGEKESWNG